MSEKKREQAYRLYEAIGGVDPELLAASEKVNEKKVVPFFKYAKVMAACLALILVGGTAYLTLSNGMNVKKSENTAADTMNKVSLNGNVSKDAQGAQAEQNAAEAPASAKNDYSFYEDEPMEGAQEAYDGNMDGEKDSVKEYESAQSGFERQEAAASHMESSAEEAEEGQMPEAIEGIKSFKLDVRTVHSGTEQYLKDKWMGIDFGDGSIAKVKKQKYAEFLYQYLSEMELSETEDAAFDPDVTVQIFDADGEVTDSYGFSGKYLKKMGLPETYEIMDPDYDFDELLDSLQIMAQED